jgi:hypothetical protein
MLRRCGALSILALIGSSGAAFAEEPQDARARLLWLGEFSRAKANAAADPAEADRMPAYENLVKAEELIAKKRAGAARHYFWKVEQTKGFEALARYWVCRTYELENNPLRAEDCYADAGIDRSTVPKDGKPVEASSGCICRRPKTVCDEWGSDNGQRVCKRHREICLQLHCPNQGTAAGPRG